VARDFCLRHFTTLQQPVTFQPSLGHLFSCKALVSIAAANSRPLERIVIWPKKYLLYFGILCSLFEYKCDPMKKQFL
jgi:hypothetical protein